jgi:hypothetical protein
MFEASTDILRIVKRELIPWHYQSGTQQWLIQRCQQCLHYRMIWNSDANCTSLRRLQAAWNFPGRLKYKGVTTWRTHLEQPVLAIIHLCVIRDFCEITAHQRKVMSLIHLPYGSNSSHNGFIVQLATKRITRIGRVSDYSSGANNSGCLPYQPQLRVFRMD